MKKKIILINIIFILILAIIRGFNGPDATSADIIVLTPVIESKEATLMDLISLDMFRDGSTEVAAGLFITCLYVGLLIFAINDEGEETPEQKVERLRQESGDKRVGDFPQRWEY